VGAVFDTPGQPIAGAQVIAYYLVDTARVMRAHTVSGAGGMFQLGSLQPGGYVIVARRIGYVQTATRATVQANAVNTLTLRMRCNRLVLSPQTTN
jgi:Carboxypeptidase regulatory-like domain